MTNSFALYDIVCIRWGDKYDFRYVENLYDQCKQATDKPFNFICYTDQPERMDDVEFRPCFQGLNGWYQKLGLFRLGELSRKTIFLDLDVIVTGDLDSFFEWPHKFGINKDFIWDGYNSSVMVMQPNIMPQIYDDYIKKPYKHKRGDQAVIEKFIPAPNTFPDGWLLSYKVDRVQKKPEKGKIVIFHGEPNPPDCGDEWIKKYWK